jgi:glycosyltransferase involved in cell wall biosynthesis
VTTSRAPRIGLNAHLLNLTGNYRSAGINWYIFHLLASLSTIADFDYTVFLSDRTASQHLSRMSFCQSRWPTHRPIARIAWEQLVQPFALRHERIDLLHALAFAGPLAISIPWVVTVYDLSFIRYPQSFNAANRTFLAWAVGNSVRRADRIIAISESTRRDLISIFGAHPDRVTVIYCGTDPAFAAAHSTAEVEAYRTRRHLPDRFILHVGTIEPRKNIARLIRAFGRAKRAARLPHKLVLIGARGWKYTDVDQAIEQEKLEDDVIFGDYVPQDELPLCYRAADLFVYPSLYEGFGMPPLDAMAGGTPVVTSNAASLPEVVGDAALQVLPDDEAALADAITRALTDPALREQMIVRGFIQAARFSWARAAQETAGVYHTVLKEKAFSAEESEGDRHAAA